jgi:hypothetical protein
MPKLNKEQAKQTDEAESAFGPLDAGIYLGTLAEVTVAQGNKGPYWSWKFSDLVNADTDEKAPGSLWVNTSLSAEAQWKMKEVFDAFEVSSDADTDELVGQQIQLVVSQREIERGARMGQIGNNVDACLPLGASDN